MYIEYILIPLLLIPLHFSYCASLMHGLIRGIQKPIFSTRAIIKTAVCRLIDSYYAHPQILRKELAVLERWHSKIDIPTLSHKWFLYSDPNSSERFFSVMKVPRGTLRIKRSTQCLEVKLLLITAKYGM